MAWGLYLTAQRDVGPDTDMRYPQNAFILQHDSQQPALGIQAKAEFCYIETVRIALAFQILAKYLRLPSPFNLCDKPRFDIDNNGFFDDSNVEIGNAGVYDNPAVSGPGAAALAERVEAGL